MRALARGCESFLFSLNVGNVLDWIVESQDHNEDAIIARWMRIGYIFRVHKLVVAVAFEPSASANQKSFLMSSLAERGTRVCNRYASDIRKAGLEKEFYGFEEWSETRITPLLGNALLEVFPKSFGPVIVSGENRALEWRRMRWGLPGPATMGGAPVTNIRNVASAHWRPVLGVEHRCLVPFTAFSEYDDASPKGAKQIRWFAPPDRGMLFFAGVWRVWSGDYGSKKEPNVGEHALFSFLTTDANDLVRPIHAKAMPVVLATPDQREEWLSVSASSISGIQSRVLPSDALEIVPEEEAGQFVGGYLK